MRANASACAVAACAIASTIASICFLEKSASSSQACLARRASARASAIDVRSRSEAPARLDARDTLTGSATEALALRQDAFDFAVRPRDDVNRHELANAPRGRRSGIGR